MSEVTTRILNWRDFVLEKWGEEYNVPETAYKFGGARGQSAREFKSTDNSNHGVYRRS